MRRVISAFSESLRDRIEDKLPHVTVPTLVVRGAKDVLVPQEWAEEVTRLLPVGRLVVAPQAGHMVPYRRPDLLADLVGEFLARELLAIDADAGTQVGKRRSVE